MPYRVARPPPDRLAARVSIDVRPSEDAEKYLATDQLVWFGEVTRRRRRAPAARAAGGPAVRGRPAGRPRGPAQRHLRRPPDGDVAARRGRGPDRRPDVGRRAPGRTPPRRARRDDDRPPRPHPRRRARDLRAARERGRASTAASATAWPRSSSRSTSAAGTTLTAPHLEDEVAGDHHAARRHAARPGCHRAAARLHAAPPRLTPGHDPRLGRLLPPLGLRVRRRSCATRSRRRILFARRDGPRRRGRSCCAASTSGTTPARPAR